jgi:lipoprotein-anchoring transpeptidase ErfK/SrfK
VAPAAFELQTNVPGRSGVPVDLQVAVTAVNGTLEEVVVESDDDTVVAGDLNEDGTRWLARERLEPGTSYAVTSTAVTASGGTERRVRRFATEDLSLDQQTWADVAPLNGETVGVGMPVIVTFDLPVTDRAALERHMRVTSSPAQDGSWHWLNANEAHWRPAEYWQAGSEVTVDLDINSVDAGGGIYGQESRHVEFEVGDAHVYKVNARTHQMQVFVNGERARTIPITTGKEGFTTRSGVKVIIEKFDVKRMNSETVGIPAGSAEAYDIDDVQWAMRLTYSGEFIHAAPWSVSSQGRANVSHGCTGMSTENASWLYDMTLRGDVVEYTGTDRPMEPDNGYGDWNVDWASYKSESALG